MSSDTRPSGPSPVTGVGHFAQPLRSEASDDTVVVRAPAGVVRGRRQGALNVFTGIPFGASTAGIARFRAPRPAAWNSDLDATRPAVCSPQAVSALFPELPGVASEDCLQLNIWAPSSPGPHPVLVWIHGGSNIMGGCGEPIFDTGVFARDGLVAVNINYRLGALGFLELGGILGSDYRGSANNALRDQLLALAWIKHNIAAFGGDPDTITVAGESAGAIDLCCLLATTEHRGLFTRAILASGGQVVHDPGAADAFAKTFVEELGGEQRLLTASADEILDAQERSAARWPQALPYRPMIDGRLLVRSPIEEIAAGSARDTSLLIGICRDETAMLIPPQVAGDPDFPVSGATIPSVQMERIISAYAALCPGLSRAELVWKATTAEVFGVTSMRVANAQAASGAPVYRFRFDYAVPEGALGDKAGHGADVPLVFEQLDTRLAGVFGYSPIDEPMQRTMHAIWSSFARTGSVDAGLPTWPQYGGFSGSTMVLDREARVARDGDIIDREVWRDVSLTPAAS